MYAHNIIVTRAYFYLIKVHYQVALLHIYGLCDQIAYTCSRKKEETCTLYCCVHKPGKFSCFRIVPVCCLYNMFAVYVMYSHSIDFSRIRPEMQNVYGIRAPPVIGIAIL